MLGLDTARAITMTHTSMGHGVVLTTRGPSDRTHTSMSRATDGMAHATTRRMALGHSAGSDHLATREDFGGVEHF